MFYFVHELDLTHPRLLKIEFISSSSPDRSLGEWLSGKRYFSFSQPAFSPPENASFLLKMLMALQRERETGWVHHLYHCPSCFRVGGGYKNEMVKYKQPPVVCFSLSFFYKTNRQPEEVDPHSSNHFLAVIYRSFPLKDLCLYWNLTRSYGMDCFTS